MTMTEKVETAGIVRGLFAGSFDEDLVFPYPKMGQEEKESEAQDGDDRGPRDSLRREVEPATDVAVVQGGCLDQHGLGRIRSQNRRRRPRLA